MTPLSERIVSNTSDALPDAARKSSAHDQEVAIGDEHARIDRAKPLPSVA
jgi:hypothetical protein